MNGNGASVRSVWVYGGEWSAGIREVCHRPCSLEEVLMAAGVAWCLALTGASELFGFPRTHSSLEHRHHSWQ